MEIPAEGWLHQAFLNAPIEPDALRRAIAAHHPGGGSGGDAAVNAVVRNLRDASLRADDDPSADAGDDPMGAPRASGSGVGQLDNVPPLDLDRVKDERADDAAAAQLLDPNDSDKAVDHGTKYTE